MMDNKPAAETRTSARTYTMVWLALMILTALTVAAADTNLRRLAIVVCLGIAATKAILVFLYFMHLRHEKSALVQLVIPITVVTFAVLIGLTYSDIITR